jgi:hypothetical protein
MLLRAQPTYPCARPLRHSVWHRRWFNAIERIEIPPAEASVSPPNPQHSRRVLSGRLSQNQVFLGQGFVLSLRRLFERHPLLLEAI